MDKKIAMNQLTKKITKRAFTASLGLFLMLHIGYAQDVKLAGIGYAYYPKSELEDATRDQEVSFNEFTVFLNFPKQLKNNKTVLINGVGYAQVNVTLHNLRMLQSSKESEKLQAFFYQLTLVHQWNEKWALLANIKPTIASDFEEKLSSDDLVLQGLVMATKTVNDKFKWGVGVINSTRWGKPIVLPVINIRYKSGKSDLNVLLPMNLKYTYSVLPDDKLNLGVKYNRNGADFNVSANDMTNIDKINYSRGNIGLVANYQLTKILRLETYGGMSTGRIYRLIGVNEEVTDFDSKPAPFFNIGVALVPPRRE